MFPSQRNYYFQSIYDYSRYFYFVVGEKMLATAEKSEASPRIEEYEKT